MSDLLFGSELAEPFNVTAALEATVWAGPADAVGIVPGVDSAPQA